MSLKKTAVILTNLGTPAENNPKSVGLFLREFLSDQRVVEIPAFVWWFILNLFIVPFRSKTAHKGYDAIWTDEGSPLLAISQRQKAALQAKLGADVHVDLMMRYGEPSFKNVLNGLMQQGYNNFVVLPLYPQNSATTTATSYDQIARVLRKTRAVPDMTLISNYHADAGYINALAASIKEHWQAQQRQRFLLMSFHGLPQVNVDKGDPYYDQCMGTAHLLATILGLSSDQWGISFQSRFGAQQWLKPYTSELLKTMAGNNLKEIDVICPGFSVDCLETLEEIQVENRDIFMQAGGTDYHYIPCLNDRDDHIDMMAALVRPHLEKK